MFREFNSRKLVIISASILMLMGLRWLSKGSSVEDFKEQTAGFSYEMPRVASLGNEFDLSGREIDRQIMSKEEKKEAAKVEAAGVVKKDDKKAKAKDAKKQAKSKDVKNKKKIFSSEVVNTRSDQLMKSEFSDQESVQQIATTTYETPQKMNAKTAQQEDPDENSNAEEKRISAAEWKARLSHTPSAENVAKFVRAHTNNKISDQDFYGIIFAFYVETNAAHNELALTILGQDRSAVQFVYLAKSYSKVDEQRRAKLWTLMLGFAQPNRIAALNGAITNQDQAVARLGLQVLKYAVDQQTNKGGTANARGIAAAGPQTFVIFIGPLNTLSKQQTENGQMAKIILTQIQALLNK